MSSHYQRETFQDIFNFFQENAPLEFEKFARKVQTAELKENIEANYETKDMPDHYTLESRIAGLIDACTPEMFNAPHACIVMYKDYRFAYANVQDKQEIPFGKDALAKVYLKEAEPEFTVSSINKNQERNPKDPEVYMMTDMFATKCLKILLKRLDETLDEQLKEVREFMGNMPLGEDRDQLSNASGEFGHEHTNPIPVNGLRGEIKYLNRLRCNCGVGLMFHRLGSIVVDGIEGPVDIFETVCLNGKDWDTLFFHFYHPRRSVLIPKGYSFSDFHPVSSKVPIAFGTNQYDENFPFGLSKFIIMQFGEDRDQGKAFASKYESFLRDRSKFNKPTTQCDKFAANRRLIEEQKKKVGFEENDSKAKPRQKDDDPGQGKLDGIIYKKGDFIGQKYQVYDVLGMGGFGIVYLVFSHETKYVYALKTLRDEYLEDAQTRDRFRKEAQVWIDLERHPYLVRAFFVDEISGRLFIAMEYVAPDEQGLNSLANFLRRRPLDIPQSLRWAIQFCYGMEYAYSKGVRAHRDIKPANILIDQDKTIKISDFGLAGVVGESKTVSGIKLGIRDDRVGLSCQTKEGIAFGTPTHMPPEQFINAAACDEKSDIYSFGIVLYQMATGGKLPFLPNLPKNNSEGESRRFWHEIFLLHSRAPIPKINSPILPVIQRCLEKEMNRRYCSFRELRKDLEPVLKRITGETIKPAELKPLETWEWNYKGASFVSLGLYEEAMSCFDRALKIDPGRSVFWSNKGKALVNLDRIEEAIRCYDKALELDPQDANAWIGKGGSLHRLERFEEAIHCYDKIIDLNARDAVAWYGKGLSLGCLCRFDEAIRCYDKALELDPQDANTWIAKGLNLYQVGSLEEGIYCIDKSLNLDPQNAGAWSAKGAILGQLGRREEAMDCFQEADRSFDKDLELHPQKANARIAKTLLMNVMDRSGEDVISNGNRGDGLTLRDAHYWHNKGLDFYKNARFMEAIYCFEKVLALNPKDAVAWYNKGLSLHGLRRFEEAIISFNKTIEINPRDDNTWFAKGLSHDGLNQLDEALYCFEMTLEINPNYVIAWYPKALVQEKQKKSQDAAKSYGQFISQASVQGVEKNYIKQIEYAANRLEKLKEDY
jgi:tetratricopeptide (TPR) repeat protein